MTAHGIYEVFLNGERVGDAELTPGFTSYGTRLYVQDYDVTDLVNPGENEIRITVSDGWWRGKCGPSRQADFFGHSVAVIARLQILDSGRPIDVVTDEQWRSRVGSIVAADLTDGQETDFRRVDVDEWSDVEVSAEASASNHLLERPPAPPVRRVREYQPISVQRLSGGRQIVDFGVNLNGWVRLSRLGPAGRQTTLTHGEALSDTGDLTTEHVQFLDFASQTPLPLGQVDRVISRGDATDVFEPRHTTHGFRYVAVDGCDEDLTAQDITAVMARSDLIRTGQFWCDNPDITRLHEITVQSWESNTCDIPTDCPQRERWGYTGDFQIFADAAAYMDDISGFGRKWLRSLADDQDDSGKVTDVAPDCGVLPGIPRGAMDGSAGWGDAATLVPWAMYNVYGDKTLLAEFLPMMTRWVDWAANTAASDRHADRIQCRPDPAPHEQYIWDTGFQWGEWAEPDNETFDHTADKGIIATAYLARSSEITALAATEIGDHAAAATYGELHRRVRDAWQREFIIDGALDTDRQANYVRALAFALVPDELRSAFADRLVELIRSNGGRLNTGFLSTGMLLPVLAETGHLDLAYGLLTQRAEPSWFAMLDRGATTIWESWHGLDESGRAHDSQDHYSKGAVISFLHRYIGGIVPQPEAPAYREFTLRIRPTAYVSAACASLETVRGTIRSEWRLESGVLHVEAHIPPGATATIDLPGQAAQSRGSGTHSLTATLSP